MKVNKAIRGWLRSRENTQNAMADDAFRHTATTEERNAFTYSPKKGYKERTVGNAVNSRRRKNIAKMLGVD